MEDGSEARSPPKFLPTTPIHSVWFRDVSDTPRYGDRMRRVPVTIGTRDEILAELERLGRDRAEHGKPRERVEQYVNAHTALEQGADVVTADRMIYLVAGGADSPTDWDIAAAVRHATGAFAE